MVVTVALLVHVWILGIVADRVVTKDPSGVVTSPVRAGNLAAGRTPVETFKVVIKLSFEIVLFKGLPEDGFVTTGMMSVEFRVVVDVIAEIFVSA